MSEQEPKIESSIDLMVKRITSVSKESLERYARGEISAEEVRKKVEEQVDEAIDMLVG